MTQTFSNRGRALALALTAALASLPTASAGSPPSPAEPAVTLERLAPVQVEPGAPAADPAAAHLRYFELHLRQAASPLRWMLGPAS